jgi:hypothetical protein
MFALESDVIWLIVEKPDSKQYFSTDFCAMGNPQKKLTQEIFPKSAISPLADASPDSGSVPVVFGGALKGRVSLPLKICF